MKVLFFPTVDNGGAAHSFMEMITILIDDYNIQPVVITQKKSKIYSFCENKNIEVYSIKHVNFMISEGSTVIRKIVKRCLKPIYYLEYKIINYIAIKRIENKIDLKSIDLIHTNLNRNDIGAKLSIKHKIPHIWHIREFGELDYKCYYLNKNYIKDMNNSFNIFIAISKAVAEHWIKKGISKNKIKVIYNGIDTDKFYHQRNQKTNNDKIKILFSGAIRESKGQVQAIKAIEKLGENIGSKIELDIYGTGAKEYIIKLQDEVNNKKLGNIIKFKGFSDKLDIIINNYDIGLICSTAEGFGRVTAEYMLSGLCVIASNTGANPELIQNNKEGLLYDYNNIDDLAEKISVLVTNPSQISKLAQNGQEKAIKNYTATKNAKAVFETYESVID